MDLLLDQQSQTGTALLMISHDLGLAATYAEDVIVMYAGKVVERAPTRQLFGGVRMPYTQALLDAIPRIELEPHVLLPVVGGRPPDLSVISAGCSFAPRCPSAQQDCREQDPPLQQHEVGRWWACWHPCGNQREPAQGGVA
jgi:oligopeptide/dipeptide ABC transporter ATP-binding protein